MKGDSGAGVVRMELDKWGRQNGCAGPEGVRGKEDEPMDTPPRDSRRHYESVSNAAARVEVSSKTVRRWITSGRLAGYVPGRVCCVSILMSWTGC